MLGPLLSVLRVSFGSHAVCVVGTVSGLSGPLAPIVCPSLESSVAVKNSSCGPRCPLSWWRLISGTDAAHFQFLPQASDSCSRFSSLVGAGWVSMRIPEVRGGVPRRAARARAGGADVIGARVLGSPGVSLGLQFLGFSPFAPILPSSGLPGCPQAQLHVQAQQAHMDCLLLKAVRGQPPV